MSGTALYTVVHRLDLLGYEARDHITDTRLRAASLNDASWVHLKFSGHGMGLTTTIWS